MKLFKQTETIIVSTIFVNGQKIKETAMVKYSPDYRPFWWWPVVTVVMLALFGEGLLYG